MDVSFLYRDPHLVAVDKPPGVVVVPDRGTADRPVLSHIVARALGVERIWVVHRLDADTSGVVLLALDAPTHRLLSMRFERGEVEKRYLAVVQGSPARPHGVVRLPMEPDPDRTRRGRMRVAPAGGMEAVTAWRRARTWGPASLLQVHPHTGRTHQIRVHLQAMGHPLLVDPWYGGAQAWGPMARLTLHAESVTVVHGEKTLSIQAPLPPDLGALVEALDRSVRT